MPINHYFQGGNGIGNQNEKRLYEDLIVEGLKIYGHDVYYLPRTLVNRDLILGEDTTSRFDDSWLIEMYIESTEGFAGSQELISKFNGVAMVGGVTLNGQQIFSEALTDVEKLEIEIRKSFEMSQPLMIG